MITTKWQSWGSIVKYYESLVDHKWDIEPMVKLVKHIVAAYSNMLCALTSLDKLIISIYENIDRQSESLHIAYGRDAKKFCFSYFGGNSASKQPEWERTYDAEIGIKKFDDFTKIINW